MGIQICSREGAILRVKRGRPRTCPTVDILDLSQQQPALIGCRCQAVLARVHIGANWQLQLNRPCAASMRPYVNYFDHLFKYIM